MSLSAMLDATARLLYPVSMPIAQVLSLPYLPAHFHTLVLSFITFQVVGWIAPVFLVRIFPIHFGHAKPSTKHSWSVHMVSMVHVFTIIPLAFSCLDLPELNRDRAFGYNIRAGHLLAITSGFMWDTLDTILHFTTVGFVVHAFVCLLVFTQSFRPFLQYYGARFLLWELSTPFLNFHWCLDKTNRTGGILQVINGFFLMATFFIIRLCYGGWMVNNILFSTYYFLPFLTTSFWMHSSVAMHQLQSVSFFQTLIDTYSEVPLMVTFIYGFGNLSLQVLNWYWFYKMFHAMHKRFRPKVNGNVQVTQKKTK